MTTPPTASEIRALADRLVTDELVVVPVRHHSPACARQVRAAVRDLRPSVVLVEGPRSLDPLVPLLAHPEAVMPLAVYSYTVPDQRRPSGAEPALRAGAHYPFCDYSPELVAVREARAAGVPVRFVDLDLAEQRAAEQAERDEPAPGRVRSLLGERHLAHSAGLQRLAEQLGCRDHEDLWELLFEVSAPNLVEHVAQVAAYCLMARRDQDDDLLRRDGTTAREAEMTWHVHRALDERRPGAGPVLVVVGGFHAVALPGLLADPPPRPEPDTRGTRSEVALVRYSFADLERLHGYAAGMTAPAWHQRAWDGLSRPAAVLDTLFAVADELRDHHARAVPIPAVQAAHEQALRLADLRGRPAPLRTDLADAVTSCLVPGDVDVEGVAVEAALRRVLTGERVGVLPPGVGTPPLVRDTLARLRGQRLDVDSGSPHVTSLDLYRRERHRVTSRLLHGLALLGVPFATWLAGPNFVHGTGLNRLQERWDHQWSPATESALVEASALGQRLPDAVAVRFAQVLVAYDDSPTRADVTAATGLLARALQLGLHDAADTVVDRVLDAIGADPSFPRLVASGRALALLVQAREPLEATRLGRLPDLGRAAYTRAIGLGRSLLDDGGDPAETAQALAGLRDLVISEAGSDLDHDLYWDLLSALTGRHPEPLVRGAATGLLHGAGRLTGDELAAAVDGHLGGAVEPAEAVAFLSGVLSTARETAWQRPELVGGLDARLRAWDEQTFVAHLPELRLAFSSMTPSETDRVARAVAGLHGRTDLGRLDHPDTDDADLGSHLALSAAVAELLRADGLGDWAGST